MRAWRAASWQESPKCGKRDEEDARGRRLFMLLAGDPELPVGRHQERESQH